MKNPNDGFIKGRLKSLKYAFKGVWLLITTEDSVKVQITVTFIAIVLGFVFDISSTEWVLQLLAISSVLVAEAVNTVVEKIADFVHADYHEKIGFIKDIAAGAPCIAACFSLVIACIIYIPKIMSLF